MKTNGPTNFRGPQGGSMVTSISYSYWKEIRLKLLFLRPNHHLFDRIQQYVFKVNNKSTFYLVSLLLTLNVFDTLF